MDDGKMNHAETVLGAWQMRCPKCGKDDQIEIEMFVWGLLKPDGTAVDEARDGSHHWNDVSPAVCTACEFSATVFDFENAAQASEQSCDSDLASTKPARRNTLSESDAAEIFYALDSKRLRILNGDYGGCDPDLDPAAWAEQLDAIMAKIGPDGCCLVDVEFSADGDEDGEE